MVTDEDRLYYERRAEMALKMAAATEDPDARRSHYTLANLYLDRAFDETPDEDAALADAAEDTRPATP